MPSSWCGSIGRARRDALHRRLARGAASGRETLGAGETPFESNCTSPCPSPPGVRGQSPRSLRAVHAPGPTVRSRAGAASPRRNGGRPRRPPGCRPPSSETVRGEGTSQARRKLRFRRAPAGAPSQGRRSVAPGRTCPCRGGAPLQNLAQCASRRAGDDIAPAKPGVEHPAKATHAAARRAARGGNTCIRRSTAIPALPVPRQAPARHPRPA